jgi:predicted phage terminase large subunit-like protein
MFIDDAVHQDNIGNIEQLTNVIDRFVFMRSIVEPYGYIHVIGTPYSDSDLYAWLEEEDNGGWMRKFRRSAWAITNSHYMPGTLLTADDVQLLFPERFTFEFLNSIRKQNEFIFNCQYLLDPTPVDTATFTEQLIIAHTIPHAHIPKLGTVFQTWDLAFSEKQRADFTCGVTGLYDTKGNLFILDLVVGRFSPHALVQHIAAFAIKWRPRKVAIENAGGSKLLAPALDNLQRTLQRSFNIEWVPPTPFKSKAERILGLQPLLAQHKLYFSAAIDPTMFAELKKQFKKFPRNLHDDIPDAISMLLPYAAKVDIISEYDERNEPELLSCMWDSMQDNLLGAGLTG